jgi:hypothetical protein
MEKLQNLSKLCGIRVDLIAFSFLLISFGLSIASIYHALSIYQAIFHLLQCLTSLLGLFSLYLDLKRGLSNYCKTTVMMVCFSTIFYVIFGIFTSTIHDVAVQKYNDLLIINYGKYQRTLGEVIAFTRLIYWGLFILYFAVQVALVFLIKRFLIVLYKQEILNISTVVEFVTLPSHFF